jgi:hypothetical protein
MIPTFGITPLLSLLTLRLVEHFHDLAAAAAAMWTQRMRFFRQSSHAVRELDAPPATFLLLTEYFFFCCRS